MPVGVIDLSTWRRGAQLRAIRDREGRTVKRGLRMALERKQEVEAEGKTVKSPKLHPQQTFFAASCSPSRDWGAGPAASACWTPATLPLFAASSSDLFAIVS